MTHREPNIFLVAWVLAICIRSSVGECINYRFNDGVLTGKDEFESEVEHNQSFHNTVLWSSRLIRPSHNFTEMLVKWDAPHVVGNRLCAFKLNYYRGNASTRAIGPDVTRHYKYIHPNETQFLITSLEIGTSYHAFLEAIFDHSVQGADGQKPNILRSWMLIAKTSGYGPDNPCNCVAVNTKQQRADDCDIHNGQCNCKNRFAVIGVRCETCTFTHYMRPDGCYGCDGCPKDTMIGNGSCHWVPNEHQMQCYCNDGYRGYHCEQCDFGFYKLDKYCVRCNCSGNQPPDVQDFCDPETGRCKACDHHTAGDRCEHCYPGYVGNAFLRSCTPQSTTGHDISIAVICIVIIAFIIIAAVLVH